MAEDNMPATEATVVENAVQANDEKIHYELAFHILPTVAEEEVAKVHEALKAIIKKEGGSVTSEEEAKRYDLAYEITKAIDGNNQRFLTSYFGWVRFIAEDVAMLGVLKEELDSRNDLLRYIIVKLTKEEITNPFRVHEVKTMMPRTVGEESDEIITKKSEEEDTSTQVQEEELDESLEKITQ